MAGVSCGSTAVNLMPSALRSDSATAYAVRKRMAALAPAYPPDSGDPLIAAPLEKATTALPGASGASSASRVHPKACCTSTSQLRLNVCQVCRCSGRDSGRAPALSTSTPGR